MAERIRHFDDFVSAIVNAIEAAKRSIEVHQLGILELFFERKRAGKKGGGAPALKPKMVTVELPKVTGDAPPRTLEVPLIGLVPMTSLSLKEVEVEFDARLEEVCRDERAGLPVDPHGFNTDRRMLISLAGKRPPGEEHVDREIRVRVLVQSQPPAEGLARLNDQVLKHVPPG